MATSKLRGPAIALALALISGVMVLGQDPLVRVPAAPGPHPLQALGRPAAVATADRPGLDILAWRRDFTTLSSAEYRGARPGADVALQGKADAMEALLALDADTSPSSIILSLAADRGLTLGVDGAATGLVAGVPVRVSASFYQSRDNALARVAGGLVVSGTQIVLWSERSAAREPLIVSVRATFGTNPEAISAVAAFGSVPLTATVQVDADGNGVASPGDTLRYRLTIPNVGDTAMSNVAANLPLDANTTAVAGSLNVSPIALDQAVSTNEDVALPITLTGSDADGNALTYTVVTPPAHGGVVQGVPGSASVTYTPAANYSGADSFTVRNNDGRVSSNEVATISVTIGAVNDAPSFTKGADVTVLEDSSAQTVAGWATAISKGPADESGQTLTFVVTNNTNAALFTVAPAVNATNGNLTFTPAANAFGTATITLRLDDNGGGANQSPTQSFTITLTAVNDVPSFTKGADQTVLEDSGAQSVPGWATAVNAGPNEGTQIVTFEVTNNNNTALFAAGPAVASNGTLTYTPAANANGSATITLRARDDGGTANLGVDASPTQAFVINVTAVNDAPSFTKGPDVTALEDSGANTVAGWATAISKGGPDESAQTLTFVVTNNTNAALFTTGPAVNATNGNLTFTTASNAHGTATITLRLDDNGGTVNSGADQSPTQTFTITLTNVNDAPSFTVGANQAVLEDAAPQTVAGWATSLSPGPNESGQVLTFEITGNDNPGLFAAGPAVDGSTGTLTYTPAPNAVGLANITLRITDDGGTANSGVNVSPTQAFTITLTAVNDAPSFTKGADVTVLEDSGANTVAGWATAISKGGPDESGQTLTFVVTNNTNAALFSTAPTVDPTTGALTFTPTANAFGTATITLRLDDNGGVLNGGADQSPLQTFDITITNVNDVPSFTKGADQTVLEDAGAQTVTPWATAISAGPNEGTQTVAFQITNNTNTALFSAQPAVSPTGVVTYTPLANANGSATITLRITDNGGVANSGVDTSATQTFDINVTAVNDAPSADDDAYGVNEGATLNVPAPGVLDGDTDVENSPLSAVLVTGPAHASSFTLNPDGSFSYTHDGSETPLVDTFTYRANDGGLDSNVATVTITITPINDAPFASDNAYGVNEGTTLTQVAPGVLAGDTDAEGTTLTAVLVAGPAHASSFTLNPDGSFSYTHDGSETPLTDTFTYRASDGLALSNVATVTIAITPVNDLPVIDLDADNSGGTTGANYALTFTEGDPTTFLQDTADAVITDADHTTLASLKVALTNRLDPGFEVLDVDLTGFPAFTKDYDITTDPAQGVLTITSATPQPIADYVTLLRRVTYSNSDLGPDATTRIVTFVANDGTSDGAAATTTVTVVSLNTPPTVVAGATVGYTENGPAVVLDAGLTVSDPDSSIAAATLQITSNYVSSEDVLAFVNQNGIVGTWDGGSGTLSLNGTTSVANYQAALRTITYVNGSDNPSTATRTVTWIVNDGTVASAAVTSAITVTAVNDAPTLLPGPSVTFTEDDAPLAFAPGLTISDPDDTIIESGVVGIVGDYQVGQDFLAFTNQLGITGTWNPVTGVITFTGAASVADYQTALRTVTYVNTSQNPFVSQRLVIFKVNDGDTVNPGGGIGINVVSVNDVPVIDLDADDSGGTASANYAITFNENAVATLIEDPADASITDADHTTLSTLTVTLTNLLDPTFETLAVNLTGADPAFSASYDTTTTPGVGVLTITASPARPIAEFVTLLRTITYRNTDDDPTATARVITFVANDGVGNSSAASTTVTIVPVDDAPTADDDGPFTVAEGGTLNLPAPGVLDGDLDAEGHAVTVDLSSVVGPAHASSFSILADGSFSYTHDGSETTTDSFTYRAIANGLQSNIATVTITITNVNDPPTAVDDAGTTTEDAILNVSAALGVLLNDTDPDVGDTKTVAAVNGSGANVGVAVTTTQGATVTLNADGSYSYNPAGVPAFQALNAGQQLLDTFTYTMQDTAAAQSSATVTITVTGLNDAPIVATGAGAPSYTENAPPVPVAPLLTVTDVDDTDILSATIQITGNPQPGDALGFVAQPGIVGNYVPGTFTLTLTGPVLKADFEAALRSVAYSTNSEDPNTTARTVTFVINDGDVDSAGATKSVAVVSVNDAPSITAGATLGFTEGNVATAIDTTITVTDVDNANIASATVQITGNYVNGQDVLSFTNQLGITQTPFNPATGTLVLTGSTTKANWVTALRTVRYFNGSANPSEATRTVTWVVSDGALPSAGATSTITVTAINSPPSGGPDSWQTFGNTELVVDQAGPSTPFVADTTTSTFGVLDNDTDPEGNPLSVVGIVTCADVTAPFVCATTGGGSVTMESNGRFTYTPQAGDTTPDTFQYQLRDQPTAGAPATVAVTVTLNLVERIWYVDGNVTGPGTGTSTDPFKTFATIAPDSGADPDDADDYIFVHNSTVTSGITLETGQRLFGEGHGLSINQSLNGNPAPVNLVAAGTSPTITSTTGNTVAVLANAGSGNRLGIEIRGLTLSTSGAASNAIDVTSTDAVNLGVTIENVTITAATAEGIDINHGSSSTTSTVALTNVTVTSTGNGIDINETAGTLTVTGFSDLHVDGNTAGSGIVVTNATFDGTPAGAYQQIDGGTTTVGASGNAVGGDGVRLVNITGDLAFDDLDIYSGGANGGLSVTGAGAVNVAAGTGTRVTVAAGVAAFESTGGPVVDVNNATIDLPLASAIVNSSATTGVSLVNVSDAANPVGPATFSATTGSIASTTGISFNVSGGNATISYAGNITQPNNAAAVSVVNHAADSITFTGTVDATNGTGLQFSNATGTYGFTSTTTLHGGDAGIDILAGSTGTFSFGTGTAITDPSGTAFNLAASNANVTYSGSITDASGFAVDIDNHDNGIATFNTGTITSTGTGLRVANSGGGTINFNGPIALTTGASKAVTLDTGNAGGTITFNPSGAGLDISTTTGTGFSVLGGGTVTVQGSGNTINASAGTALDISTTALVTGGISFASTTSAGAATAVRLANVTPNTSTIALGTGSLGGTLLVGDGGGGVNSGGTAVITYGGSITTATTVRAVDIQDRASGAGNVTLSGTITHSSGNANVIFLDDNAAGTITFSGASSVLNGGTQTAVSLTDSGGATINFTGGSLNIAATSGGGFIATGGGIVAVTGTGNTIATGTGTAMNLSGGTTIGVSDLTFQSIAANGATNGITLTNTGATGGLTVTGTGASLQDGLRGTIAASRGTGGTIQNTTGDAIVLNNVDGGTTLRSMIVGESAASTSEGKTTTNNVAGDGIDISGSDNIVLENVKIARTGGNGILGNDVTNFSIKNSEVLNAGDANDEDGLNFAGGAANHLDGTVVMEDNIFSASAENNVYISNATGTLALTIDNSLFTLTANTAAMANGEDGLKLETVTGGTSPSITATVSNSTFDNLESDGIIPATNAGTITLFAFGNTFTGYDGAFGESDNAISLGTSGSATLKFNVHDNVMNNSFNSAVIFNFNDTSTVHGIFEDNQIVGSIGNAGGRGIDGALAADDSANVRLRIDGNIVTGMRGEGMFFNANNTSTLNIQVTNNNITTTPIVTSVFENLTVQASSLVANSADIVAKIENNTVKKGQNGGIGGGFIAEAIRLSAGASGTNTIQLEQGGQSLATAVRAALDANNPGAEAGTDSGLGVDVQPAPNGGGKITVVSNGTLLQPIVP